MMVATPTHLLTESVTVERKTEAAGTAGRSPAETWSTHLTGVMASIQPMSTAKAMKYGSTRATRMWSVFVATGQDITTKDRLVYIDTTTGSNVTRYFRVVGLKNLIQMGAVLELDCEETQDTP